jgi:hypothetical protein
MFSSQENLFLQAIQKMLSSSGNEERQKAESDIKIWSKESYTQILETCNKFIICEQLDINTRRYACYLMTLLINEENYEKWQKLEENLKKEIKNNSLSLLGNKINDIRHSATILVASIEKIAIKNNDWQNLIKTLCNACESNEIEFKISSIKTLGLIWEFLNKDRFSKEELILMENSIIKILLSSDSLDLISVSLRAYKNFINYIIYKYKDIEYLQSSLKMLTKFCNFKNYNESISITAIHRLSDVVIAAYDFMETNINNIIEFIGIICNGENEDLAIQSYIFLIDISKEEFQRIKNEKCKNYIDSSWGIIWGIIQNTLNTTINPSYNNEYNRYKSLSSLLYYLSKICSQKIINDIFLYMKSKIESQNTLMINSAIYVFASILETVHISQIKKIIFYSINSLCQFMNIKNEELNKTIGWCLEQICEIHGEMIIKNPNLFKEIIILISNNLKRKDLHPKIKIYLCTSLFYLTKYVKKSEIQKLGIFSQYLLDLLKTLDYLAYLPSSFDIDYNLSRYCFLAISGLIKSSQETDEEILNLFLEQVIERFSQANELTNFKDKQWQYQVQSFLCLVLESFCKEGNRDKLTYQKIEIFFNKIESFFHKRGIFEEGLQALSKLSLLISNKEFSNFLSIIMEHIYNCLRDYQDFSNCKVALLCLIDLITTSKENFSPYIGRLIQYFQEIMKKPDANKELLSYFLIIYSDLFENIGESIWEYVQIPLEYMKYVLNFCINNSNNYLSEQTEKEDFYYYLNLNDNVMDLIENILKRIIKETNERKKAFFPYVTNIIYYLNFMLQKLSFIPSNDYIISCIGSLFDLLDVYKENILKLLNDETSRRLSLLANETKDGEIISLNQGLQDYIYTLNYNLQLNQDDIF